MPFARFRRTSAGRSSWRVQRDCSGIVVERPSVYQRRVDALEVRAPRGEAPPNDVLRHEMAPSADTFGDAIDRGLGGCESQEPEADPIS